MLFFLSLAVIFKSMDFPFTVSGISPMSSVSEIQVLQEIQEIQFLLPDLFSGFMMPVEHFSFTCLIILVNL